MFVHNVSGRQQKKLSKHDRYQGLEAGGEAREGGAGPSSAGPTEAPDDPSHVDEDVPQLSQASSAFGDIPVRKGRGGERVRVEVKKHRFSSGCYFEYTGSKGEPVRIETDPSDWERHGREHRLRERGYEFYTKKLP